MMNGPAVARVHRLILIGDTGQLPLIGAGRPFVETRQMLKLAKKPSEKTIADSHRRAAQIHKTEAIELKEIKIKKPA